MILDIQTGVARNSEPDTRINAGRALTNERESVVRGCGHPSKLRPSCQETESLERFCKAWNIRSVNEGSGDSEILVGCGIPHIGMLAIQRPRHEERLRANRGERKGFSGSQVFLFSIHRRNSRRTHCLPQVRRSELRQSGSPFCWFGKDEHAGHAFKAKAKSEVGARRCVRNLRDGSFRLSNKVSTCGKVWGYPSVHTFDFQEENLETSAERN